VTESAPEACIAVDDLALASSRQAVISETAQERSLAEDVRAEPLARADARASTAVSCPFADAHLDAAGPCRARKPRAPIRLRTGGLHSMRTKISDPVLGQDTLLNDDGW